MAKNVKGDSYYGGVAQNYEVRRQKQAWWHVEQEEMLRLLQKLPRNMKVLDVPFGTGRFVQYYIEMGHKITGLDASHAMIAQGAEILGDKFHHCTTRTGTSTDLPFDDNEFDLFVSTRFLRDIVSEQDAHTSLQEFARVTSKYAIIQLGETTAAKSKPIADGFPMGSNYSAADNETLLRDCGFKILEKVLVKSDPEEESNIFHILCEK